MISAEPFRITIVCLLFTILSACTCGDGGFVYNTAVRIIYDDGTPVAQARVVGFDTELYADGVVDTLVDWGFSLADATGRVTIQIYTGLTWGGCPPPDKAPIPERPEALTIYAEYPHGHVESTVFHVTEDQITARRSGELDIDLGEIVIARIDQSSDTADASISDAGDSDSFHR